jgi:hypothetical protein
MLTADNWPPLTHTLSIFALMTPQIFTLKGAICETWTDRFLGCSSAI